MKKSENVLGIVAVSLFVLGTLLKMLHLPPAAIMAGVSVVIFNLGYLPLQLIREQRKATTQLETGYLVFRFITLFISLIAFYFKLQHWQGAGILLIFSSYLIPSYITFYFYMRVRGKGKIPFQSGDLIITILAYMIYIFVTRSMVSPKVVRGYVILEEQYSKLNSGLQSANNLVYSSLDSVPLSGNKEVIESIHELKEISGPMHMMLDSLRTGFINSFYTNPIGEGFNISTASQSLLANVYESHLYFMETPRASELKSTLENYMNRIVQLQRKNNLPASLITNGMALEDSTGPYGETQTWEERMFDFVPIASAIATLSRINQEIYLTERGLQNQLTREFSDTDLKSALEELASGESRLAIELKENEILRISQQQELQRIQLEKSQAELAQRNTITGLALAGIVFVLVLLFITSRAYLLKQRDNKQLAQQKEEISTKNTELSRFNKEISAQRDEIEAQRDEIEAQRNLVFEQKEQIEYRINEIRASIDYAMRLQDAMLSRPALLEQHFSDHFIFFRPKQMVSGDFYWWTQSGDSLVIAVADCTGHGVPGAFMSLLGASLLKEIVNREGITIPGRILDRMREEVIIALDQKGAAGEQKDGMDMAVISLDPRTLRCRYAGANNPLYLLRRSQLTIYRPDKMPVSYYGEMVPFQSVGIDLQVNDQLYLFSDGYADQFGGEKRKKFKYPRFRQVLTENGDLSMPRQQQLLSDTIREWQGKYGQTDDMVIVGIRI